MMFAESSSLAWFYEETFRWGQIATRNVLVSTFGDLQSTGQRALFFEYLGREGNKPALGTPNPIKTDTL